MSLASFLWCTICEDHDWQRTFPGDEVELGIGDTVTCVCRRCGKQETVKIMQAVALKKIDSCTRA